MGFGGRALDTYIYVPQTPKLSVGLGVVLPCRRRHEAGIHGHRLERASSGVQTGLVETSPLNLPDPWRKSPMPAFLRIRDPDASQSIQWDLR